MLERDVTIQGYSVMSPSDRSNRGLLYFTKEAAQEHADRMNKVVEEYPKGWNTEYWPTKPEPYVVYPLVRLEDVRA